MIHLLSTVSLLGRGGWLRTKIKRYLGIFLLMLNEKAQKSFLIWLITKRRYSQI